MHTIIQMYLLFMYSTMTMHVGDLRLNFQLCKDIVQLATFGILSHLITIHVQELAKIRADEKKALE